MKYILIDKFLVWKIDGYFNAARAKSKKFNPIIDIGIQHVDVSDETLADREKFLQLSYLLEICYLYEVTDLSKFLFYVLRFDLRYKAVDVDNINLDSLREIEYPR